MADLLPPRPWWRPWLKLALFVVVAVILWQVTIWVLR
jgi:hypothetical protein